MSKHSYILHSDKSLEMIDEQTPLGELSTVIKDVTDWTAYRTSPEQRSIRLPDGKTITGTISEHVNLWQEFLSEASGFYVADYGVSFTPNEKETTAGNIIRYWYARKRVNGKLHSLYAGSSKKLTHKKIIKTCEKLIQNIGE